MFYRYTQGPELKSILKATVEDLLSVQNPNGSIACTPEEQQPGGENGDLWERKYVMLGLDEYYRWVEQNPAVLEALKKHADCLIAQIGHAPKTEIVDLGWSATNIGHEACHIESSTLLEPFMRLYNWTGEQRYLDFASYIVESGGTKHFDLIQQACDNTLPLQDERPLPQGVRNDVDVRRGRRILPGNGRRALQTSIHEPVRQHPEKRNHHHRQRRGRSALPPLTSPGEAWGNTAFEQTNPDITRMMETCVG